MSTGSPPTKPRTGSKAKSRGRSKAQSATATADFPLTPAMRANRRWARQAYRTFESLSEDGLLVLRHLGENGTARASEISRGIGVPAPTVSQILKTFRERQITVAHERGPQSPYSLTDWGSKVAHCVSDLTT